MCRLLQLFLLVCVALFCASQARAYFPIRIHPSVVIEQADVIVVGRLKEGSVEHLPVKGPWGRNGKEVDLCVSRATLIITRVEHGKLSEKQVTIWFRGNATPVVGGRFEWDFGDRSPVQFVNRREPDAAIIHIYEINTGPYKMGDGDLRTDHLWLLRSGSNLPGLKPEAKAWFLDNAQYVVAMKLKETYLAYPKGRVDDFPLE